MACPDQDQDIKSDLFTTLCLLSPGMPTVKNTLAHPENTGTTWSCERVNCRAHRTNKQQPAVSVNDMTACVIKPCEQSHIELKQKEFGNISHI